MKVDLAIKGGRLATPMGVIETDVFVKDGKVLALGRLEEMKALQEIDARGLVVMPGMVDAHVHMMDPGHTEREDFTTGTAAAAVGGVTTVIEHHRTEPPVHNVKIFREKVAHCEPKAMVDFAFMGGAIPGNLDKLKDMWDAGAVAFKTFVCELHGVEPMPAGPMRELFKTLTTFDGTTLIHAEDDSILKTNELLLRQAKRTDYLSVYDWRSEDAEYMAVNTVVNLASQTGARAICAHVSQPACLRLINEARLKGAHVYAESCPHYFYVTTEDLARQGPWLKFAPAVRPPETVAEMRKALGMGMVDYIGTDHCPFPKEMKAAGIDDIWAAPYGIPGMETTIRLMLNLVSQGVLGLADLVRMLCETPARLYGLYPGKGCLLPGSDADMILVDPEKKEIVRNRDIVSKCGWSPFDGMELTGKVVKTLLRGKIVAEAGRPAGEPGDGRFIPRTGSVSAHSVTASSSKPNRREQS